MHYCSTVVVVIVRIEKAAKIVMEVDRMGYFIDLVWVVMITRINPEVLLPLE